MEENFLTAEPRTQTGSRAARRMRKTGRVPAVIYGQNEENVAISVDAKAMAKLLHEGRRIVTIQLGQKADRSVVKEVQYDAYGNNMVHVDFTRIRRDQKIEVAVPIETFGVPKGLSAGGVLSFPVQEILVSGLPEHIPQRYRLNIEALEIGNIIRLKELAPPPNCTFLGDADTVIVAVVQKREEVPVAPPVEVQAAQPEVIGKKKEEGEAEPEAEPKKKEKEKEKES